MLREIVEKLVILGFVLILNSCPSPSEFFIRRIITFSEKSVIRLQCGEDYEKPLNVGLMSSGHVQNERSFDCFLELISYFDDNACSLHSSFSWSAFSTAFKTKFFKGGFGQGLNLTSSYIGTHIFPSLTCWMCCTVLMELLYPHM